MITEDYCSYEVAKLLKKKGFDEPVTELNRLLFKDGEKPVLKITHQKAMKWLREVHKLFIEIQFGSYEGKSWYSIDIIPTDERYLTPDDKFSVEHPTYEEAVETALNYALKNLI